MKWLAISLGILSLLTSSGCWRPYYGNRFGQPMYAQPAVAQPTFQQPIVQSAPVVQSAPIVAQPQMVQAAPVQSYAQPCVPCQPNPCCVPCY